MRFLAVAVLAMGSLLASPSVQAHSRPTSSTKYEALTAPVHVDVAAFGPGRPSISVHTTPSFHATPSFHSTPAYHSFAPAPSRPFTFSARPTVTVSPSISTRPAPTYSRPATASRSSVSMPPVIHHYPPPVVSHYESRTGGMSMTEALLLHQALASSNTSSGTTSPGYASASSTALPVTSRQLRQVEDDSEWAVGPIIGLGLVVVIGGCLLIHLATRKERTA